MKRLIEAIMYKNHMSRAEALEAIKDVADAVMEAMEAEEDAEEVFVDETGLEPDYFEGLLEYLWQKVS